MTNAILFGLVGAVSFVADCWLSGVSVVLCVVAHPSKTLKEYLDLQEWHYGAKNKVALVLVVPLLLLAVYYSSDPFVDWFWPVRISGNS